MRDIKWKREEIGKKGSKYQGRVANGIFHFGLGKTKMNLN